MNLIAKEYIASRCDGTGVLILSEMAGAAKELGEAVIINPNNREEISAALKQALEMPREEQIRRNSIMQHRLRRYDIISWATEFINKLSSTNESHTVVYAKLVTPAIREKLLQQYERGTMRLLLLDYDGTLVGFARRPRDAKPPDDLLRLLILLAEGEKNDVVLVSGRRREDLDGWFGKVNISLVAEHGAWIKERNDEWKIIKPMANDWKTKILPILEMYSDRLPGAFVEEKDFSLAWHYRASDPEHGDQRAHELMDDLVAFTANIDVQVLQGNKVIEVRNAGVNKGVAGMHWITKDMHDFILAIGDDWTDEDLFAALPQESFSIRVGFGRTQARYQLRTPHDVLRLLQQCAEKK